MEKYKSLQDSNTRFEEMEFESALTEGLDLLWCSC